MQDNGNIGWVNDGDIREVVADNIQISATSVQGTKYSVGQKVRVSSYYASSTETDSNKAVIKTATGAITRIVAGQGIRICWTMGISAGVTTEIFEKFYNEKI